MLHLTRFARCFGKEIFIRHIVFLHPAFQTGVDTILCPFSIYPDLIQIIKFISESHSIVIQSENQIHFPTLTVLEGISPFCSFIMTVFSFAGKHFIVIFYFPSVGNFRQKQIAVII